MHLVTILKQFYCINVAQLDFSHYNHINSLCEFALTYVQMGLLKRYQNNNNLDIHMNMQPIFNRYRPLQIARFVKVVFKGHFGIKGVGEFYFDKGKVLLPDVSNKKQLKIMKEVNLAIHQLSMES